MGAACGHRVDRSPCWTRRHHPRTNRRPDRTLSRPAHPIAHRHLRTLVLPANRPTCGGLLIVYEGVWSGRGQLLVQHVEPGVEADYLAGDRAEAAVGEQRDRGADVLGFENSA